MQPWSKDPTKAVAISLKTVMPESPQITINWDIMYEGRQLEKSIRFKKHVGVVRSKREGIYVHLWLIEKESEVVQSCLTLCDTVDYSLPGSSVHGILQAKILECIPEACSFMENNSRI